MSKHYVAITPRFLSPPPLSPTKISSVCFSVFGYRYPHIVTFVFSFCPDIRGRVRTPGRCTRVKLAPLSHPLTSHRIMSFIGSDLSQIHRWITRFHRFFNVGSTGCILSVALPLIPESYVNFQISGRAPSAPEGEGLFAIHEKLDLSDPGLCSRRDSYFRCW